eukprot:CAMPEP_0116138126 /NCGR_PEP_ID=MMETSP0329-20121206/12612_1 /TAXON_ID=697910 /ORGANISM="Pseudo-nitzschia arenysensis, Strain B593" /LENGTH=66 /DNA_ID=CAMNT_0003633081 /DNA_START=115 /DNA_END=315 /DNA_ORIENTATION=-
MPSTDLPKTASKEADQAFLKSLSPEFLAQQERIMNQIEKEKFRKGRANGSFNFEREQLSIRDAVFC